MSSAARAAFETAPPPAAAGPHAGAAPGVSPAFVRQVIAASLLYTMVVLAIALLAHPTPLYFVETDLVGEYVPAADALARGRIDAGHHAFKGPGYPLLLGLATRACGGDWFLAARLVSVAAAGVAACCAALLVARFAGTWVALFTLGGLFLNPVFLRYAVEAGTDAPGTALMLAATGALLAARAPAGWALAGALAGLAMVTRWNAAFLVPAGMLVLVSRPRALPALAVFVSAALAPTLLWNVACLASTGHLIPDRNYLNVAYELYGRDHPWDRFESAIGGRFRSMADVLAYDPVRATSRIAWNLVSHFGRDLSELVPLGLGLLVPPGLVLAARRPAWRPALLHAGACAVALAPVFYSPRFSLYLLPFLLAAAGTTLHASGAWAARRFSGRVPRRSAATAAMLLVAGSGALAVRDLVTHLAQSPEETRAAAAWLRERGHGGRALMARKPHAARFAGMEHRPMPGAGSVLALHRAARAAGAEVVLFSPIETTQRPQLAVLGDSGVALPGFTPLHWARVGKGRASYALYRVEHEPPDSIALAEAVEAAVLRYADRRPGDAEAQAYAAMQLLELDRPQAAIARLGALERRGARDPMIAELLSNAFLAVGDLKSARHHCRRAMAIGRPTAWHHARLGALAEREGDLAAAQLEYERAVAKEPANLAHLEHLGRAYVGLARYGPAASVFERCARLAPGEPRYRRLAMGAHQFAGNPARARRLFDEGVRAGIAARALLEGEPASAASR